MEMIQQIQANLLSPIILSFFLGILACFIKSDLRIPPQIQETISIYLLFAIGLKGGAALANAELHTVVWPAVATMAAGLITPVLTFWVVRNIGQLSVVNSAAIAAHYGSVSVITFMAALTYLQSAGIPSEGFMPALVVVLEIPGIFMALLLVKLLKPSHQGNLGHVAMEILSSKSIVLLIGGLAIGYASSREQLDKIAPLFQDLFQGFLALFLLEMGIVAASRMKELRTSGLFLVLFGILMPIINGSMGILLGHLAGLSMGGLVIFGTMVASASYIAAPAAIRVSLPDANPALYLTSALVITFPFNILFGIPIYHHIAQLVVN